MSKIKYDHFGVMIDCSRNAVMSVDGLRRFLPLLKKMGYNTVMLYTEDTYEVDGEPYFGYMRGRYTKDELKELDAYAASLGIEMIPCIQTLAHLNATFRWGKVPCDADDVMLVDVPRTYEFIGHLFQTLRECFRSKIIHVGMDEAHFLGRGAHLDKFGFEAPSEIIKRHLSKVVDIAKEYDFSVQIWSDMFFRSWNTVEGSLCGKYYIPETKVPEDIIRSVPDGVSLAYWDYYHGSEAEYDAMIKNHKQFKKDVWFAGGAWTWTGLCPRNGWSLTSMLPAMDACKKNKLKNVYFTMWGDDGGECSRFAVLPALFYLSQYAHGETNDAVIKEKFRRFAGVSFDDFTLLDIPNQIPTEHPYANPSKYMLLSDVLNDYLDYTVDPTQAEVFGEYAEKLRAVARKTRTYGYLFDTEAKLCDVLRYKYALGYKTRKAYEAGDKEELRRLATEDYTEVEKRLPVFLAAAEKQWFKENNPSGFDVQDLRIGGTLQRIKSAKRRILDYVNGKISHIDELDEALLPYGTEGKASVYNNSCRVMTVNIPAHGLF